MPKCTQTTEFVIPEALNGYSCEWADCYQTYSTFVDFLDHIKIHVNSNPKYCKKGEIILCLWIGKMMLFYDQCMDCITFQVAMLNLCLNISCQII